MKTLPKMLLTLALVSSSAYADLEYQMSNIIGDWDFGQGYAVLRIQKQTETSVKVFRCKRSDWLASNGSQCNYTRIFIDTYNDRFEGFCAAPRCSSGLQVSLQYSNEMIETIDPLYINNASNAGKTVQATKGI